MNLNAVHSVHQNDLFVSEDERVSLSVRNLEVVFKKRETKSWREKVLKGKRDADSEKQDTGAPAKQILNNISLDLPKGQLLAILGASGSGKTTLLNTLSSRLSFAKNSNNPFQFEGLVHYSQKNPNISYLLQEDLFMPGLTVRETLKFTAQLKLPNSSNQEIDDLIDYLFHALDLKKVENTIINDFKYRCTLSGGEKRRVSLAIQLLTKPSVLFLDEPTTGLDSNTSIHLVQTVKDLATNFGITIIMTIHQPRSEILEIVDQLCLLAKGGSMMFMGSLEESKSYFEQNDLVSQSNIKDDANFADFLLKVSAIDQTESKQVEMEARERVNKLVTCWLSYQKLDNTVEYSNSFEPGHLIFNQDKTHKPSFSREVKVLMHRCTLLTIRDVESMITFHGIMTMLAIILGYAFYKPGGDLGGIRSTTSLIYVCCDFLGFTPLLYEIERLCATDGRFFVKEYKEGIHSISGFIVARKLVKLILEDIPITLIWSVITYFMWGLNETSDFGIFFINNFLLYGVGMGTALVCFMLGKYEFGASNLIVNYFYQLQNSACGYFINAKTMPVYVRWTKYLANFWYGFGSLVSNTFSDFVGDCPYEIGSEECYEYTGEYVLKNLGYPKHWYVTPIIANIAWMLAFNIASGILLWYQSKQKTVRTVKPILPKTKTIVNDQNSQQNKEILSKLYSSRFKDEIEIRLKDIRLTLKPSFLKNKVLHKPYEARQLLKDIDCSFKPGVNAIMGPSGSGKTTLLNFVTGRTQKSTISTQGDVFLNQSEIPYDLLKKITTYVVQDDNVLIPSLTVRETLYYQAKLRLDVSRYPYIPIIISDLIRKIGLSDVADIPIGDAQAKGISGGEKRRVSIAIQLLNDSKILLLDEPTSGLDSFTSSSIISLLNELAITENKTIILTIHQPKIEIFQKFDNILLLANGSVIYDGKPLEMIEYFDSMGLRPDSQMNFADYILDVISNRSENGPETANRMINNWSNIKNEYKIHVPILEDKSNKRYDIKQFKPLIKTSQSLQIAFKPILERQFKVIMRSPNVFFCRLGQLIGLSIIHALYFSPLRNDSESILNRLGLIQQVLVLYFAGMISNITVFPIEKSTFYQEYEDNTYNPLTFMICYLLNEIPFEILTSFIFAIFTVLVIGLPREGGMFFTMFYMCFAILNCGESVGMIFTTIFDHLGIAVNFVANLMIVGIFLAGTMSINMPVLFKAFNYISPLKYTVLALADLSFSGQTFKCSNDSSSCSLQTGEQVIKQYKFDSKLYVNYIAVAVILVLYRLCAYGTFEFKVRVLRK